MTDLLLHDLENLTKERLILRLSNEKREMLGDQSVLAKERNAGRFFVSPRATLGTETTGRERRGKKCYNLKS